LLTEGSHRAVDTRIHVLEVPGANLGTGTGYPDKLSISIFSQTPDNILLNSLFIDHFIPI
jgi:hypothetical protein